MSREENLRSFIRDSHAVDEAGDPLRLYHGTADDFSEFRLHSANKKDAGWLGRGFYFTNSPSLANSYSMIKPGKSPNVMPVHLALKNPFYATPEHKTAIKNALMEDPFAADDFRNRLIDAGYDGVVLDYGTKDKVKEYVAFHPEQIKSATGNQGTFDPNNPEITKAEGGTVDDEDQGITAYHGSPHEFDQFDISKIGTGEGAQSYGHGLYFAEAEPVALGYRDKLSSGTYKTSAGEIFDPYNLEHMNLRNAAYKNIDNAIERASGLLESQPENADKINRDLEKLYAAKSAQAVPHKGHMYEVKINAHPDHFIDWDKPLRDQKNILSNVLNKFGGEREVRDAYSNWDKLNSDMVENGRVIDYEPSHPLWQEYDRLSKPSEERAKIKLGYLLEKLDDEERNPEKYPPHRQLTQKGEDLWRAVSQIDKQNAKATDLFRELGIPGIKYLDQASRSAGEGSRNYVVFDDKLVTTKRRYERGGAVYGNMDMHPGHGM